MLPTANRWWHLTFDCSLLENMLLLHDYSLQAQSFGSAEVWLSQRLRVDTHKRRHMLPSQFQNYFFYMINHFNFTNINSCPPGVCLYLWGRSSPRTPCPVASCLPGPPTHSSGSATATFWLMDCWGRGLPEEMGGQSGAWGAQGGRDGDTSPLFETFSPGYGETWALKKNRGSSDGWYVKEKWQTKKRWRGRIWKYKEEEDRSYL